LGKIIKLLKDNPNKYFTAKEIAKKIVSLYPKEYEQKRKNPRFKDENEFISQVVAEIGALKNRIIKQNSNISWRDKPRPRVYWFEETKLILKKKSSNINYENEEEEKRATKSLRESQ